MATPDRQPEVPVRKVSAEFIALIAIGITVLLSTFGQAIWLDGKVGSLDSKVERMGSELRTEMRSMRDDLRGEIKALRDELRGEIKALSAQVEEIRRNQVADRERLVRLETLAGVEPVLVSEKHM